MRPKKTSIYDPVRCEKCEYFCHHYVLNEATGGFIKCDGGHCVYPRIKHVDADQYCDHFSPKKSS